MSNEVLVRTISGVTLGILVLLITWIGGLLFDVLSIGIMALVFFEWYRIVLAQKPDRIIWLAGSAAITATGICVLAGYGPLGVAISMCGAAVVGILSKIRGIAWWPAAGILYASFFCVAFSELRNSGDGYGFAAIIFIFAIIWSTDVFAFFGGRQFGGPKLAPSISPKKTWSGFFSGLLGGIVGGVVAASLMTPSAIAWVVALSAILSISGQLGDLLESGLKRRFGVKDSGSLIPGHGGVMDRMDSVIIAAFVAFAVGLLLSGNLMISRGGNNIALQLLGP